MAQRRALPQSQTRPAQPQAKEGALLLPSSSSPSSLLRLISPFPSHHTCSSHLTPSHIFSPFKSRTVYPVSFFFSFSCHFLFHRTFLFFPPLVSSRLFISSSRSLLLYSFHTLSLFLFLFSYLVIFLFFLSLPSLTLSSFLLSSISLLLLVLSFLFSRLFPSSSFLPPYFLSFSISLPLPYLSFPFFFFVNTPCLSSPVLVPRLLLSSVFLSSSRDKQFPEHLVFSRNSASVCYPDSVAVRRLFSGAPYREGARERRRGVYLPVLNNTRSAE